MLASPFIFIIVIFLLMLFFFLFRIRKKREAKKNAMDVYFHERPEKDKLKKAAVFFQSLYEMCEPAKLSRDERKRLGWEEDAYIYGEIQFLPFFALLAEVKPKPTEVFYDLGSGAGKAVFAAALCFDFLKLYGIEKLPALSQLANTQIKKAKMLAEEDAHLSQRFSHIQFINEDFLDCDFSDGDVIFIAATCYSYPTWDKLMTKLAYLKPGSRVIVATKKITHPQFQLISVSEECMSWGVNSVYIYTKVT